MYLNFFGLTEKPFSITPDPRFLYLSEKHREGLAHLLYGTDEAGSFVVLTGEVGTGKTTLCRRMLAKSPEKVIFALILNPLQTPLELLASICDEFHIDYPEGTDSRKQLIDALNRWLLEVHARGERAVVIIDEAQNLSIETLEQVRLLTNLETSSEKLLKIILIGQPELKTILERPELRQLNQRVTARYHLQPLPENEAENYVQHRLKIAGATQNFFSPAAIRKGYQIAGGIPRIMNLIFDRAMTGAYGQNKNTIEPAMVKHAAAEVFNSNAIGKRNSAKRWILPVIALLLLPVVAWLFSRFMSVEKPQPVVTSSVSDAVVATAEPQQPETSIPESAPVKPAEESMVYVEKPAEVEAEPAPAPVESETAANAIFDLNNLLGESANNSNAFTALFWRWNLDFSQYSGDTACKRARDAGYRCIFNNGSLQELEQYKLPAVLELQNRDGQLRQITLIQKNQNQLRVEISGEAIELKPEDLDPLWTGNSMIIVPTPPQQVLLLQPGDNSPAVGWLRQQLNLITPEHLKSDEENELYDDQLRRAVLHFQLDQGLEADGIAGEQTLIRLASAIYNRGNN